MVTQRVSVPIVAHDRLNWGCLNYFGKANYHIIVGETFTEQNNSYSFKDGHRVRKYKVKGNVHWAIPDGVELDISGIAPGRRQQGKK